ncbi:hypothetical protein [Candidatus Spongiihabitans sp.]|uniref:hypothetical protein n=1 Tax=Candidatus Spongiihabitans sp. TaxID=3101308 RepID=UPI003C7E197B
MLHLNSPSLEVQCKPVFTHAIRGNIVWNKNPPTCPYFLGGGGGNFLMLVCVFMVIDPKWWRGARLYHCPGCYPVSPPGRNAEDPGL